MARHSPASAASDSRLRGLYLAYILLRQVDSFGQFYRRRTVSFAYVFSDLTGYVFRVRYRSRFVYRA